MRFEIFRFSREPLRLAGPTLVGCIHTTQDTRASALESNPRKVSLRTFRCVRFVDMDMNTKQEAHMGMVTTGKGTDLELEAVAGEKGEYRIVIPAWGACVRLSSLAAGEAEAGSRAQRVL